MNRNNRAAVPQPLEFSAVQREAATVDCERTGLDARLQLAGDQSIDSANVVRNGCAG
jgi:hypothetical protein